MISATVLGAVALWVGAIALCVMAGAVVTRRD